MNCGTKCSVFSLATMLVFYSAPYIQDHLNLCHKVPLECVRCPERVARDAVSLAYNCLKQCT